MAQFWFTADYHFGHANIIEYASRPFKNVSHMNEMLIRYHNERVKPEDTVFFLGDFCFKNSRLGRKGEGEPITAENYLSRLNGRFVFIRGNHDNDNSLKAVIESAVIELGGERLFLVHDPKNFNEHFNINLVAHVHGAWKIKQIGGIVLVNVSCDVWDYRPVNIEEILDAVSAFRKDEVER